MRYKVCITTDPVPTAAFQPYQLRRAGGLDGSNLNQRQHDSWVEHNPASSPSIFGGWRSSCDLRYSIVCKKNNWFYISNFIKCHQFPVLNYCSTAMQYDPIWRNVLKHRFTFGSTAKFSLVVREKRPECRCISGIVRTDMRFRTRWNNLHDRNKRCRAAISSAVFQKYYGVKILTRRSRQKIDCPWFAPSVRSWWPIKKPGNV